MLQKEPVVVGALSRVLHNPAAKWSYLNGISGGTIVGVLAFMRNRNLLMSCNVAVASFSAIATANWEMERYRRQVIEETKQRYRRNKSKNKKTELNMIGSEAPSSTEQSKTLAQESDSLSSQNNSTTALETAKDSALGNNLSRNNPVVIDTCWTVHASHLGRKYTEDRMWKKIQTGDFKEANKLLLRLESRGFPRKHWYSKMIAGYLSKNDAKAAFSFLQQMAARFHPLDLDYYHAVLRACAHPANKDATVALLCLDLMQKSQIQLDSETYNFVLLTTVQSHRRQDAIELVQQMLKSKISVNPKVMANLMSQDANESINLSRTSLEHPEAIAFRAAPPEAWRQPPLAVQLWSICKPLSVPFNTDLLAEFLQSMLNSLTRYQASYILAVSEEALQMARAAGAAVTDMICDKMVKIAITAGDVMKAKQVVDWTLAGANLPMTVTNLRILVALIKAGADREAATLYEKIQNLASFKTPGKLPISFEELTRLLDLLASIGKIDSAVTIWNSTLPVYVNARNMKSSSSSRQPTQELFTLAQFSDLTTKLLQTLAANYPNQIQAISTDLRHHLKKFNVVLPPEVFSVVP